MRVVVVVVSRWDGVGVWRHHACEAEVVAFADLGMEAIYKFVVEDMPVSVAVDVNGTSIHAVAPKIWQAKIGKIPVVDAAAG